MTLRTPPLFLPKEQPGILVRRFHLNNVTQPGKHLSLNSSLKPAAALNASIHVPIYVKGSKNDQKCETSKMGLPQMHYQHRCAGNHRHARLGFDGSGAGRSRHFVGLLCYRG